MDNYELTQENREAGKLKHDRIIKMTQILLAFVGVLTAGIFLYDTDVEDPIFTEKDKIGGLLVLIGFGILYMVFQNSNLAALEKTLGWNDKFDDRKFDFKQALTQIKNILLAKPKSFQFVLESLFTGFMSIVAGWILFEVSSFGNLSIVYRGGAVVVILIGAYLILVSIRSFWRLITKGDKK